MNEVNSGSDYLQLSRVVCSFFAMSGEFNFLIKLLCDYVKATQLAIINIKAEKNTWRIS